MLLKRLKLHLFIGRKDFHLLDYTAAYKRIGLWQTNSRPAQDDPTPRMTLFFFPLLVS